MGLEGYDTAMARVMKQFTNSGLRYIDYESGYSRRLDSAVRQNVLDGMRSVYQGIQNELGKEFGSDGVEISAHGTCAPDHLPYQGRQFTHKQFEEIQNSLPRPFGYWNCRHSWWEIIMGISKPAYSDEELRQMERYSNEIINVDGKNMTRYEATQIMRRLESEVRKHKDLANSYKALGNDSARRYEQSRINILKAKYDDITEQAGLRKETDRMAVSGFKAVKTKTNDIGRITTNEIYLSPKRDRKIITRTVKKEIGVNLNLPVKDVNEINNHFDRKSAINNILHTNWADEIIENSKN